MDISHIFVLCFFVTDMINAAWLFEHFNVWKKSYYAAQESGQNNLNVSHQILFVVESVKQLFILLNALPAH